MKNRLFLYLIVFLVTLIVGLSWPNNSVEDPFSVFTGQHSDDSSSARVSTKGKALPSGTPTSTVLTATPTESSEADEVGYIQSVSHTYSPNLFQDPHDKEVEETENVVRVENRPLEEELIDDESAASDEGEITPTHVPVQAVNNDEQSNCNNDAEAACSGVTDESTSNSAGVSEE